MEKEIMFDQMFCFQCQETAGGVGCTKYGVCGKGPDIAAMQDILIFVTKGLSSITTRLRKENKTVDKETNHLVTQNLFITTTSTNFDKESIAKQIKKTVSVKDDLLRQINDKSGLPKAAFWGFKDSFKKSGMGALILETKDRDIRSLRELLAYGLKGLAAHMKYANALFHENEQVDIFIQKALSQILDDSLNAKDLMGLVLETGKYGAVAMGLLDKANSTIYGEPVATTVQLGVRDNPGILVSGHDYRDLAMLLNQTEGTGVDVYTHAEMLSAHYYPKIKRYSHLVGNYGNSWWEQKSDFAKFNGPILMTSNCIVPPSEQYMHRLWTTGTAGFPGCKHIHGDYVEKKDFSPLIEKAKNCRPPEELESGNVIGGFARNQLLEISESVAEAIKRGKIRKLLVIAGCDGRTEAQHYYTELAQWVPQDVIILTAGCAKYRFIKQNNGMIAEIPRVLDAGQCSDSYSLLVFAQRLKELLGEKDINNLPIIFNISWYGQKAVIVVLTMLYLGVKNIHFGPTIPAFLSPNVTSFLAEKFGINGIGNVNDDLKSFLRS